VRPGRAPTLLSAAACSAALLLLGLEANLPYEAGGGIAFAADKITLQGTGATFPAPLYQRWFSEYNKLHPDVQINYQPLGSGAGVQQFTQQLVDFGASDAAMTDEEIAQVKTGVVLLPMTAGSIAIAYNLPGGPTEVKLSREAYTGIFLGKITKWNDPKITATNPGVSLPDLNITVVTRSDGSGTTYVFTNHLSTISEAWKSGPGTGKSIQWPTGVQGKGNAGVTALIKQTPGAIGYVEYGYAKQTGMPMATLENKAGKYVKIDVASESAALAGVELPADLRAWLPDPAGPAAYPIVTYTWLLCYKTYEKAAVAATLKQIISYGLGEGQKFSEELGYIPLPATVVAAVTKALERISP
jgi:phosphate transport system substrate-binding protein